MSAVVALDVGGTGLKGAVVDRSGRLLCAERRPTPRGEGPQAIAEAALAFAGALADGRPARDAGGAAHVALAVPGLVDDTAGCVRLAPNLGWHDLPLRTLVEERLGLPALVWHDARAAALAEGLLGAARGARDWLLVTIGTGIGGAVIADGRALHGARGAAGELGHVGVAPDGPLCACGRRGCLEALASGRNVSARYAELTGEDGVAAEQVVARAERGDVSAQLVWETAVSALAVGLASCTTLLDPELIVLGGGVASAGDRLLVPLARRLDEEVRFPPAPTLRAAALGERAGWIGAALAGWQAAGAEPGEVARWTL